MTTDSLSEYLKTARQTVSLVPLATGAQYRAAPDYPQPVRTIGGVGEVLWWRAAPAPREFATIDGQSLAQLKGWVYVYCGVPMPDGTVRFNDEARSGAITKLDSTDYIIKITVAPEMFRQLLEFARRGRLPSLCLNVGVFSDDLGAEPRSADLGESALVWDTKRYRSLEVRWFEWQWSLNPPTDASADSMLEAQPINARLLTESVHKLNKAITKATIAAWLACGLLVLLLLT